MLNLSNLWDPPLLGTCSQNMCTVKLYHGRREGSTHFTNTQDDPFPYSQHRLESRP